MGHVKHNHQPFWPPLCAWDSAAFSLPTFPAKGCAIFGMIKVIYHRSDYDGLFCREIAHKFMPEAELIGWEYNDPEPVIGMDDQLYILDLSVPGLMAHRNLVWIDHHASAITKYPKNIYGYRIDGVAACRLAWQYFTNETGPFNPHCPTDYRLPEKQEYIDRTVSEPFAVCLAGEYDIWDKRDPRAELFQHGLRGEDLDWEKLLENDPDDGLNPYIYRLLEQGKALQYAKNHENESIIKAFGFTIQFEGLTFLACNHARFNSHLFTAGIKPKHDALMGFNWTGTKWRVSLYHAPEKEQHDLSLIAVKHGGGGHRGACGFVADQLPFIHA